MKIACFFFLFLVTACSNNESSATYAEREPAPVQEDDPTTTNDESNDQPLHTAGTKTLCATNVSSGNSYPLDADVDEDGYVTTIYFPKGGNVDFTDCQLDEDGSAECYDEESRAWQFDGEC